jgi:hypothetical protein
LTYGYPTNSNKLTQVTDAMTSQTYTSKDFKDRSAVAYTYDDNDNLKTNADKKITSIKYNHLNLPSEIIFEGTTGKILYDYDAEGNKLKQRVYTNTTLSSTTDYVGEFVFANNALDYIGHEEGRVVYEADLPIYEFNIKDHLGNVRQVLRPAMVSGFMATMEVASSGEEEQNFSQLSETKQSGVEHNVTKKVNQVALKVFSFKNDGWISHSQSERLIKDIAVGEVRVQRKKNGDWNLATLEPMHRNMVVAYEFPKLLSEYQNRTVLDSTFAKGHAFGWGDFYGNGRFQIVAGWRVPNNEENIGIKIYLPNVESFSKSSSYRIDKSGMASEDLQVADLNGDGKPEIIASGRSTNNLRIYWNKN